MLKGMAKDKFKKEKEKAKEEMKKAKAVSLTSGIHMDVYLTVTFHSVNNN